MATETKYPVFQNKSLDYNKLLGEQRKGKLLKKILKFPLIAMIKYDGHYCTIDKRVHGEPPIFTTSGGIRYTHDIELDLDMGEYIAERIVGNGKLGASRRGVALEGSVGSKFAKPSNTYIIHNKLDKTIPYENMLDLLEDIIPEENRPKYKFIFSKEGLDVYMKEVTRAGYEGLMLIQLDYIFKDTKSRHIDFCKYKKRPTADLLCIDVTEGTGKYTGVIGSLVLQDSEGRIVSTGSGMSDEDRCKDPVEFIGKVLEMEYEQIADTYIQPTFGSDTVGVTIRYDKDVKDID